MTLASGRLLGFVLAVLTSCDRAEARTWTQQIYDPCDSGRNCNVGALGYGFLLLNPSAGTGMCWGYAPRGGDCASVDFANVIGVASNYLTSSAVLRSDGTGTCWGQAGGSGDCSAVDFTGLTEIDVAAMGYVAWSPVSGAGACWGDPFPLQGCDAVDFTGVTEVRGTDHAFLAFRRGPLSTGTCWGFAAHGGECGTVDFTGVTKIAGSRYAFAVLREAEGTATCWGDAATGGDCGSVDFTGLTDMVGAGYAIIAYNSASGSFRCWGDARYGGDCSAVEFTGVTEVHAAERAFLGLKPASGTGVCWGAADKGGDCSGVDFTGVTKVAGGISAFVALAPSLGTATCWGLGWIVDQCPSKDFTGITEVYANGRDSYFGWGPASGASVCWGGATGGTCDTLDFSPMLLSPTTTATATTTGTTTTATVTATVTTATATATATGSTTTATATTTGTTTTARAATCAMRRMVCPIPAEYLGANYAVLGSVGAEDCQAQGVDSDRYFDVAVDECNTTLAVDAANGVESYVVTLVPNVALGGIEFVEWPDIVCSCEVDLQGTVLASIVEVVDNTEKQVEEARSELELEMTLYPDDAFDAPLPEIDGGYTVSSLRFFVEITSSDLADNLAVDRCTAAPTAEAGDPYTQVMWEEFCPVGPFDARYHEHALADVTHELRLSTRAFKFAGLTGLVLSCTVVRCPEGEACGVCGSGSGGRRLQAGGGAAAEEVAGSAAVSLTIAPEAEALVLPGPDVADAAWESVFSSTEPLIANFPALEISVTLYNCIVTSGSGGSGGAGAFVDAMQMSLEVWLGLPSAEVNILEVQASGIRGSAGRRLQDLARAEVVFVKFEVVPPTSGDRDALDPLLAILASRSSAALTSAVRAELEAAFGVQLDSLRAEKSLVERRSVAAGPETEAETEAETEEEEASWPAAMVAWVAAAGAGGFGLGGFCVGGACFLFFHYRHSRQGPASAAAAEAAVEV